jgi:hypothetical protein
MTVSTRNTLFAIHYSIRLLTLGSCKKRAEGIKLAIFSDRMAGKSTSRDLSLWWASPHQDFAAQNKSADR